MRHIKKVYEYDVYKFSELSDKAKQNAIEEYYKNDAYYRWGDDAVESLQTLAKKFNSSFGRYSFDFAEKCRCEFFINVPSYMEDITEEELKEIIDSLGSYDKETFKGLGDCVLTGYCADEDAIDGLRIAYFKGERYIKRLLMAAFNSWYDAVHNDYMYQFTIGYFTDFADANNYEFLKDGSLYN